MRDRTEAEMNGVEWEISLIRHGAAKSNLESRYLGKTDEDLSETGKEALQKRKSEGAYIAPDVLFVSPMKRCRQTAEILFPGMEQRCIPEWTEIDFGRFEGKNYHELNGDRAYQEWIDSQGAMPFPNGESREDFTERTMQGVGEMLRSLAAMSEKSIADKRILHAAAVIHGGTIMAICSRIAQGEYFDYQVKCGEGFKCRLRYAVEQKKEAVGLIRQNRSKFHLPNIEIIHGKAPECLADIPVPTHAFIGGTGGKLREILQVLYQKNPAMRIVVTAVSLETVGELTAMLKNFSVTESNIIQVQVSRAKEMGNYHLMQAENPVYICSFDFAGRG